MTCFHILARTDGTDVRTGTVAIRGRVEAPPRAPVRLARSPIEIVELGAHDLVAGAPLRVFEVIATERDYDHDYAMTYGHAHLVATAIDVVREVPFIEAIGFDPDERARLLQPALVRSRSRLAEPAIAALVAQFVDIAIANELRLDARRGLPLRFTDERDERFEQLLAAEAAMAIADARHLERCTASTTIAAYLVAAAEHDTIVHAYLAWSLVEPLLLAPPRPLANVFAPLAALHDAGIELRGFTADHAMMFGG